MTSLPPIDKQAHFWLGGFIVGGLWPVHPFLAGFVCIAVALAKEFWWDKKGHGTVDKMDAVATAAGGAAMCFWLLACALATRVDTLS